MICTVSGRESIFNRVDLSFQWVYSVQDKTTRLYELGTLFGVSFTCTFATQNHHVKADDAYYWRALDRSVFYNQKTRVIVTTASIAVLFRDIIFSL